MEFSKKPQDTCEAGRLAVDLRYINFQGKGTTQAADSGVRPESSIDSKQDDAACAFARWVLDRAGLDGNIYRGTSLRRRSQACLRTLKVRSEDEGRKLLEEKSDLLREAVESLLIGATGFFRDQDVFEGFRTVVLPALADHGMPLRIWSAGCSSGAELFSLAMILADAHLLDRSYLLGSDCRHQAIERSRAAYYGPADLVPVAGRMRARYFEAEGSRWRPIESLREKVQWKKADLVARVEPGPWDVILWRNVAIYLNPEPAALLWRRLHGELAPGGYLIAGKAERPPADLNLRCVYRQVYRKNGP